VLAQAIADHDPTHTRELAEQAANAFRTAGAARPLAEVDAWLAARRE
jgi:hypothetical protein